MTTTVGRTSMTHRRRKSVHVAAGLGGTLLVVFVAWVLAADAGGSGGHGWDGDYGDVRSLACWLIASITEPQFYAVASASACLLMGGAFAHLADRNSWRWRGFVQACGTGLWPWAVGSALLSLLLSDILWGWTLAPGVWQPLFVPLVSVAPAMVVLYGPGRGIGLTAAVAGALFAPPVSIAAVEYVCKPLDLPLVVGATSGMWVGALVAFSLVRFLPWMPAPGAWRTTDVGDVSPGTSNHTAARLWVPRRALADFSEAQFFGNEWASAVMILGAVVAYSVSPSSLVYGTGLFLAVLASQAATALAGVLIWRRRWQTLGFYPTFVPVVSVAPASVLAFGGTIPAVVAGALAGALIAPPVAAAISRHLPAAFHPFIGNVASMCICTALIVPLLDLVPGVAS
jgi:ENTS family enterobactin (siderophore) exporter